MLNRHVILAAMVALLGGCGGGGNSPSALAPPVISNLSYTPTAAYQGSGGGQTTVNGSLSFSGANQGVASVTIVVLDATGNSVSSNTTPAPYGSVNATGTISGTVVVGTNVVGRYTIKVTLTDSSGLVSNALTGGFRISALPWVQKTPMPQAREFFGVATDGSLAYIVGGEVMGTGIIPGPASSQVDVYNPAKDTWTTANPMSTARIGPVAAVVGGMLYVIGGDAVGAGDLSSVEALDLSTGTWATKASMPTPRSNAAAAVINGNICVFGGRSTGLIVQAAECFDPAVNSWSTVSAMPTAREGLGADALGGIAYAVGGYNPLNPGSISGYLMTVETYNGTTNSWASAAQMSAPREYEAVAAGSGLLFAFGGDNVSRALASVEAYNPTTGNWTAKTAMPFALTKIGGVLIGNTTIYIFDQGHTLQYTPANDIM